MELTKEAVLEAVRHAPPAGWKQGELAIELSLDSRGRHRLRRLLEDLMEEGAVERAPGARYRVPGTGDVVADLAPSGIGARGRPAEGRAPEGAMVPPQPEEEASPGQRAVGLIRVHPAGYGFVEREDGEADVFVPARFRGPALDGDRVRVATWLGYKGTEGRVIEVLARGRAKLTGMIRQVGRHAHLEPDDPRIASTYGEIALDEGAERARDGQCAVVEITRYPTEAGGQMGARVWKILGDADDPSTEVEKVIHVAEIPDTFPDDALMAAQRTSQELGGEDFADRVDLRDRPFLTIDPVTARDFDDAVCVEERAGGGHRLWVAVADVSHYVRPGTALDREARVRGCSVYLPNRAIPMLPKELSAGICSLNPEVDRCAMVVRIDLDPAGRPTDTAFCAAVIRSFARLDYEGVAAALSGDFRGPRARYEQWRDALETMNALARKMRTLRLARGSLDFDLPEARVVLDQDDPRLVRDVVRSKANPQVKGAYQLVEEFMLAANEAVARFFGSRGLDSVWRVHAPPSTERLEQFAALAEGFGVAFDPERGEDPREVQKVIKQISGQPYERALNFLLLRSMKQAQYDVVNIGHFGLASTDYLHFTSPIRRYPDLIVHRLLKHWLRKEGTASGGRSHLAPPPRETLAAMAHDSSQHERRAAEAEREITDMYRAFLMRDRVGDELDGLISGVTHFGVFIEANEPFVEGLIKTAQLGDEPFFFEEKTLRLRGRRTGRVFSLGDPVKVRVDNVSVARRQIDLSLVEGGAAGEVPVDGERRRQARGPRIEHGGGGLGRGRLGKRAAGAADQRGEPGGERSRGERRALSAKSRTRDERGDVVGRGKRGDGGRGRDGSGGRGRGGGRKRGR